MRPFTIALVASLLPVITAQSNGKFSILGNNLVTCIHTFLLPNGKVLCSERPHVTPYPVNPNTNGKLVTDVKIIGGLSASIVDSSRNVFCAGHAQMSDGKILVIGGDFPDGLDGQGNTITVNGTNARRIYSPCAEGDTSCTAGSFTLDTDMVSGRWYPTVTTLHTGNQIIVSGSLKNLDFGDLSNTNNPTYEYYPSKTGSWPRVMSALDKSFPYNLYPAVFQLHNGKVMIFVSNTTAIVDPVTDAIDDTSIPPAIFPNHQPWIYPFTPTFVHLPLTIANGFKSEIMACGGSNMTNNIADNRCISINFNSATPQWALKTFFDPLMSPRVMPDSVLLPDGKIFFSNGAVYGMAGGNAGDARNAWQPALDCWIYDPQSNSWSSAGSMTVPRLYHSGAVLLPDARVLITGSEMANINEVMSNNQNCYPYVNTACTMPFEYRMEIYEPPYLLTNTERPVISLTKKKINYNTNFGISTITNGVMVNRVALVRYSTTTHSTNSDQRYVELPIVSRNNTYIFVHAPTNSSIAPPGNYMLFLMRDGVPSVAKTLLLNNDVITSDEFDMATLNPVTVNSGIKSKASIILLFAVLFITN